MHIDRALVDLLADQVKLTTYGGTAMITLVGVALAFSSHTQHVLVWVVLGYALAIPRYIVIDKVKKALSSDESRRRLELCIGLALFLSGLHWGLAGWLFLDTSNVEEFVLVTGAILGVIASSLSLYSTRPLLCCLFATTVFSIVAFKLAMLGSWALAIMSLLILPAYAVQSRTIGKRIEKSITQDIRNAELLVEVRAAKDSAEKASQDKSHFMAATSHDLRQPLHAQHLYLQILRDRAKGTEFGELAEKLHASNEALIELFNALLEVSQLDAGTMEVRKSHHSLMELAQLVVQEFEELAGNKGLTLELTGEDHAVHSDPILLLRILRNLVSNAIKFTCAGGVCLTIEKKHTQIHVSVSDTGIGIPPERQSDIFNEYVQLGNSSRNRDEGIGLGLALVSRMCQLLGHDLKLDSTLGKGSCFSIGLPEGKSDCVVELDAEPALVSLRDLDIMVIDDEQPVLDAMRALFVEWSCRTFTYTNLGAARADVVSKQLKPDLIISDYRLEDNANGVDAINELRSVLDHPVPAIIISGDTDPGLLEKIQVEDFYLLHKPVDIAKLRKVVGTVRRDDARVQMELPSKP